MEQQTNWCFSFSFRFLPPSKSINKSLTKKNFEKSQRQRKRETRWVYGWKFPLKPSEKIWKGVVTTELRNYPEKRLGRFLYITQSGEYTSNEEQTVLLECSLETYLLSMTKQKGKSLLRLKSESNERIYHKVNILSYLFGLL